MPEHVRHLVAMSRGLRATFRRCAKRWMVESVEIDRLSPPGRHTCPSPHIPMKPDFPLEVFRCGISRGGRTPRRGCGQLDQPWREIVAQYRVESFWRDFLAAQKN